MVSEYYYDLIESLPGFCMFEVDQWFPCYLFGEDCTICIYLDKVFPGYAITHTGIIFRYRPLLTIQRNQRLYLDPRSIARTVTCPFNQIECVRLKDAFKIPRVIPIDRLMLYAFVGAPLDQHINYYHLGDPHDHNIFNLQLGAPNVNSISTGGTIGTNWIPPIYTSRGD